MRHKRQPTPAELLDRIFNGPQPIEIIKTKEQLEQVFEQTKKDYLEDPSRYFVGFEQLVEDMKHLTQLWEKGDVFLGIDCFGYIIVRKGTLDEIRQMRQGN